MTYLLSLKIAYSMKVLCVVNHCIYKVLFGAFLHAQNKCYGYRCANRTAMGHSHCITLRKHYKGPNKSPRHMQLDPGSQMSDTLTVFLKEIFEKVNFERNWQNDDRNH